VVPAAERLLQTVAEPGVCRQPDLLSRADFDPGEFNCQAVVAFRKPHVLHAKKT